MKLEDIPIFPDISSPSNFIHETRLEAPTYLQVLIEQLAGIEGLASLQELSKDELTPLLGGKMSILYALRVRGRWVVVKFRSRGGQAEAQALRAWHQVGASVVQAMTHGVIPQVRAGKLNVHYLVMEAAVDPLNDIAQTAQAYLINHPDEAEAIAEPLGAALAGMHRAMVGTDFGEFADMGEQREGEGAPQNWASYLVGYLGKHSDDLLRLGFPHQKIETLTQRVDQIEFHPWGVMLHGDFSPRNSVLISRLPYQLKVFDPNPIIGHPSWDFAILANNREFSKRRADRCSDRQDLKIKREVEEATWQGVLHGYQAAGGVNYSEEAIAAAQLMHCLYLLPQKVYTGQGKNVAEDLESYVVRESLSDKIERLTR
jgi:fructosamine-3-kinase